MQLKTLKLKRGYKGGERKPITHEPNTGFDESEHLNLPWQHKPSSECRPIMKTRDLDDRKGGEGQRIHNRIVRGACTLKEELLGGLVGIHWTLLEHCNSPPPMGTQPGGHTGSRPKHSAIFGSSESTELGKFLISMMRDFLRRREEGGGPADGGLPTARGRERGRLWREGERESKRGRFVE